MRFLAILALPVCLCAIERKLPPEFQSTVQLALAAPPEFAANGLLRLLESGRITDRATRIDLAEQAFELASNARLRVRMRALPGVPADSTSGSLAKAYELKLDAVSLQSRAIDAMLPVDSVKARQMFTSMPPVELAPLKCEDSLVYDVSAYYRTLAGVALSGFNTKEKAKEDHVAFLLQYVSQVRSPAQLAPMVAALKSSGLTPRQLEALEVRLSGRLEAISGDDRSFSASVNDLSSALPPEMSASFAKYVDRNLGNTRCEENVKVTASFGGTQGAKTESSYTVEPYWQSDAAQRLMAGARKLRFGDVNKVLSDADRATPEWQQQLADFEKDLDGWQPASEKSEADYYHQKCLVYEALVELIPAGPERDKALQAFIAFINSSNLQTQKPVEWFEPAQSMLERVRNTNGGEPAKVLAAFVGSGNPALALYASLETLFQKNMPTWVTAGASGQ